MEIVKLFQTRLSVVESAIAAGRDFVSFADASVITGIKVSTLRIYSATRKLNVVKQGRRAYLRLDELTKLV